MSLIDSGQISVSGEGLSAESVDVSITESSILLGSLFLGSGARLSGEGTLTGDLTNAASFSPGRLFTIEGDFIQQVDGELVVEVAGTSAGEFDSISVDGMVTLGGNLSISLEGGFSPMPGGPDLLFVVSGAVAGEFSFVESDDYDVAQAENGLVLQLPPQELLGALASTEDDEPVTAGQVVARNLRIDVVSLEPFASEFDEFFASEAEAGFDV